MSGTELVHSAYVAETTAEIMRLKRDLAAAREDAERYRWLRDQPPNLDPDGYEPFDLWYTFSVRAIGDNPDQSPASIDAAIDAARAQGPTLGDGT